MSEQDWWELALGAVAHVEMGQAPPSQYVSDRYSQGSQPFLQGNAEFTQRHPEPYLWCSRSAKSAQSGDSLISVRAPVGALNAANQAYCIGRGLAAVRFHGLDARFGHYQLALKRNELHRLAQGSTFDAIGSKELRELRLFAPEQRLEQRKIAEILDTLDDQIRAAEQIIAKLNLVKQGIVGDLLLTNNPEIRRPLRDLSTIMGGVTLGSEASGPGTVRRPYLRVANVQDGRLNLRELKFVRIRQSDLPRYSLADGDVLMNEGGDADKLGRGTVWESQVAGCLHQNHVFRVRVNRDVLEPWYLAHVSASTYGKRYFLGASKQTTNLATINSTQIGQFPVPLVSLSEQRRIISIIASNDYLISGHQQALEKLKTLKDGLMADLLTARVRVPVEAES